MLARETPQEKEERRAKATALFRERMAKQASACIQSHKGIIEEGKVDKTIVEAGVGVCWCRVSVGWCMWQPLDQDTKKGDITKQEVSNLVAIAMQ